MKSEEIAEVLRLHGLWLKKEVGGKRADLYRANLYGANLSGADLIEADLRGANLGGANLSEANLRGANLTKANLRGANLRGAYIGGANLQGADLQGANLSGADLRGADLTNATLPAFQLCPQTGQFRAFKKVTGEVILELLISKSAKRTSSLVGRKCRASRVKVLSANGDTTPGQKFGGMRDPSFVYTVGEWKTESAYNGDIRVECAEGIHFFLTIEEATAY